MASKSYIVIDDVASNLNTKLSEHFKVKEFKCSDGSNVLFIDTELLTVLEDIRTHFNASITINSGYRTVSYNSKLTGSSKKSQHCLGKAADIVVKGKTPNDVYGYLTLKYPNKYGIGIYNSFVHVDVRDKKSRWNYTK